MLPGRLKSFSNCACAGERWVGLGCSSGSFLGLVFSRLSSAMNLAPAVGSFGTAWRGFTLGRSAMGSTGSLDAASHRRYCSAGHVTVLSLKQRPPPGLLGGFFPLQRLKGFSSHLANGGRYLEGDVWRRGPGLSALGAGRRLGGARGRREASLTSGGRQLRQFDLLRH